MIVTKKVEGEVDYNDGQFAEGPTIGIEGIEKDLWLSTFQIHLDNTRIHPMNFDRDRRLIACYFFDTSSALVSRWDSSRETTSLLATNEGTATAITDSPHCPKTTANL